MKKGIPLFFYRRLEEISERTGIKMDNNKCGYRVSKHLIEQGCKRIGPVGRKPGM